MNSLQERFLRYVQIETTSRAEVERVPSTDSQFDLARILAAELRELGLSDAQVDEHSYVFATLPSNCEKEVPVIGWIAHLDTSPDVSGKNVKPQIFEYRGGEIVLENGKIIPEDGALKSCVGHRIITGDGTTLLGADDKAGIAAIMDALQRLIEEDRPHGTIRIGFTPDEEVGNGTAFFDPEKFGAFCAYTVDGELPGELNCETFTAQSATIRIEGREIHPGTAKNVMINAVRIAAEIVSEFPKHFAPETTEGPQPYIHPYSIGGSTGSAIIKVLLRGFCDSDLEQMRTQVFTPIERARERFPGAKIECEVKDQYRNMKEELEKYPKILEKLEQAARRGGVEPFWKPIRGGTDGSRLTELGLPTPNIYTGGHNFHSPLEWVSVHCMEQTVQTLLHLAEIWTEP